MNTVNLDGFDFVLNPLDDEDYKGFYVETLFSVFKNEKNSESVDAYLLKSFDKLKIKVTAPTGEEFKDWDKVPNLYKTNAVMGLLTLEIERVEEDNPFAVFESETVTYKLKTLAGEIYFITLKNRTNALQSKFEAQGIDASKIESNKWLRGEIHKLMSKRIALFHEIKTEAQGYESKEIPLQHILRVIGEHFAIERRKN
jgi:hypothetical protein